MTSPPAAASTAPAEPWRLIRWRIRQLAYRELLAPGVELTLMRIPAGSFLMGAAEEEKGSRANERPLHLVQVGEFLISGCSGIQTPSFRTAFPEPPHTP
jgi:formylglycine-generating enzyme required for sulfatase activity